jgi:hypothetical protein
MFTVAGIIKENEFAFIHLDESGNAIKHRLASRPRTIDFLGCCMHMIYKIHNCVPFLDDLWLKNREPFQNVGNGCGWTTEGLCLRKFRLLSSIQYSRRAERTFEKVNFFGANCCIFYDENIFIIYRKTTVFFSELILEV